MTEKGLNAAAAADLMSASLERLVDSRRADHGQLKTFKLTHYPRHPALDMEILNTLS